MLKKLFKSVDYITLAIVLVLFLIGMTALYSANGGGSGDISEVWKQGLWFGLGIILVVALIAIDYNIFEKFWIPLYIAIVILLVLVLFTEPINGARSWFDLGFMSIQPSEFAKIVLIITMARIIDMFKKKEVLNKPQYILLIFLIIAIPTVLIIRQPDYGTAMVLLVAMAAMLFAGGIKWRYIIGAIVAAAIIIPVAYNYVLPQHAKDRIQVFLNPESDPRGTGYNIIQSKLAVGSGQLWGMGLFNGNQTQLGLLPMKTTDFIYPVISEEMGFVFSSLVIVLFVILLIKILNVARTARDSFGTLLCTGVFAMIFAHFVENIGMSMGLLPITGIPLPFISYGGSSMLTNMIAIGIVMSVACRRKHNIFSDN